MSGCLCHRLVRLVGPFDMSLPLPTHGAEYLGKLRMLMSTVPCYSGGIPLELCRFRKPYDTVLIVKVASTGWRELDFERLQRTCVRWRWLLGWYNRKAIVLLQRGLDNSDANTLKVWCCYKTTTGTWFGVYSRLIVLDRRFEKKRSKQEHL